MGHLQPVKAGGRRGRLWLVLLLLAAAACSTSGKSAGHTTVPPANGPPPAGCRSGDPLANVYRPSRLKVERNCETVTGTVAWLGFERDGDIHIYVALVPGDSHLLNEVNYSKVNGQLIAEIVPADQKGCTPGRPPPPPSDPTFRGADYNFGTCTGAGLSAPPEGARVILTGPYVDDTSHGWMEIHPVWAMTIVPGVHTTYTPSPPPSLPEGEND